MHEGVWEQEVSSQVRYADGFGVLFHNPDRSESRLLHDVFNSFQWMLVFYIKRRIWCSKWEPFHLLLPLSCHVVSLDDGNCRLTMPVVKGCFVSEALAHAYSLLANKVNPALVSTVRFYDRNELYGSPDVRNCRMPNFLGWAFFLLLA